MHFSNLKRIFLFFSSLSVFFCANAGRWGQDRARGLVRVPGHRGAGTHACGGGGRREGAAMAPSVVMPARANQQRRRTRRGCMQRRQQRRDVRRGSARWSRGDDGGTTVDDECALMVARTMARRSYRSWVSNRVGKEEEEALPLIA